MKRKNALYLFLLFSIVFIDSCRKTDEDPLISLRSRKARVIGEWNVEKGTIATESFSYSINGNTFIYTDPSGYFDGTSSISFIFKKDGTCKTSIILSGFLITYEGTWNFTGGIGENKNKSQIVIHFKTLKESSGNYTYSGNTSDITFDILELR